MQSALLRSLLNVLHYIKIYQLFFSFFFYKVKDKTHFYERGQTRKSWQSCCLSVSSWVFFFISVVSLYYHHQHRWAEATIFIKRPLLIRCLIETDPPVNKYYWLLLASNTVPFLLRNKKVNWWLCRGRGSRATSINKVFKKCHSLSVTHTHTHTCMQHCFWPLSQQLK